MEILGDHVLPAKQLLAEILVSNSQVKKGLALLQDLVNSQRNEYPARNPRNASQVTAPTGKSMHGSWDISKRLLACSSLL